MDTPPKILGSYLVRIPKKEGYKNVATADYWTNYSPGWRPDVDWLNPADITHWMPLPEEPAAEGESSRKASDHNDGTQVHHRVLEDKNTKEDGIMYVSENKGSDVERVHMDEKLGIGSTLQRNRELIAEIDDMSTSLLRLMDGDSPGEPLPEPPCSMKQDAVWQSDVLCRIAHKLKIVLSLAN